MMQLLLAYRDKFIICNLITIKVDRPIIHNDYKTEKREVFSS